MDSAVVECDGEGRNIGRVDANAIDGVDQASMHDSHERHDRNRNCEDSTAGNRLGFVGSSKAVTQGDGTGNQKRRLEEQKFAGERKQSLVRAYPGQDAGARRWGRTSGKVDDPAQEEERSEGNESDAAKLVETPVLSCNG
jgi:hypothetical protein